MESFWNCAVSFYEANCVIKKHHHTEKDISILRRSAYENIKRKTETIKEKVRFVKRILKSFEMMNEKINLGKWPGSVIKFIVESVEAEDGSEMLQTKQISINVGDMNYCLGDKMLIRFENHVIGHFSRVIKKGYFYDFVQARESNQDSFLFMDALRIFTDLVASKMKYKDTDLTVLKHLGSYHRAGTLSAVTSIYWDILAILDIIKYPFVERKNRNIGCFAGVNGQPTE